MAGHPRSLGIMEGSRDNTGTETDFSREKYVG
jgi:hypothetical protein